MYLGVHIGYYRNILPNHVSPLMLLLDRVSCLLVTFWSYVPSCLVSLLVLCPFMSCVWSCALEHRWVVYLVYPCFPYDATFGSCVLGSSGCLQPPLGCWRLHSGGGDADSKTSNPFPKSPSPHTLADFFGWKCDVRTILLIVEPSA